MKPILSILFSLLFLYACQQKHSPRSIESVTIEEFKIDSTSIRAIYAINKDTIFYAGSKGNFGKTTNGGKSWLTLKKVYQDSIIPHFRSIASNGKDLFLLSIANPALLYKISGNEHKLVYIEKHESVFYDSMKFFAGGKHGIAVGDPTEDCPSIIITSDGGNTWNKIPCDKLPTFEEGEAFFAASNTNIKIINNKVWIASGGKKARVLKSTDFGNSWKIYETPIIQGNGPQGIYSIDFADELHGIVIGGDYSNPKQNSKNKAITKDGGKNWSLVSNNTNPNYKSCIQYVPNTNGKEVFAVGKTGISYSNDGGLTWIAVSNDAYYTIQFVDKNTAWLSGNEKIGRMILPN